MDSRLGEVTQNNHTMEIEHFLLGNGISFLGLGEERPVYCHLSVSRHVHIWLHFKYYKQCTTVLSSKLIKLVNIITL